MTGPSRISVDALRDSVRRAVDSTSLREVADQVGMSHSGLRTFIEGRRPQAATLGLVARWFYSRAGRSPAVRREDFNAAIAVIDAYLNDHSKPARVRERELRRVLDQLRDEGTADSG